MIAVSTFQRYIEPKVPGCPRVEIRNAALRACQDLCRDARIWQETMPSFDSVGGQGSYTIPVPTHGKACGIEWLHYDDTPLDPVLMLELDQRYPQWPTRTGTPSGYLQADETTFQLLWTPDTGLAGGIRFRGTFIPADDADQVPTALFTQFRETVIHGATAYLLADPQKPWGNPQLAGYHKQQYSIGSGSADCVIVRGFRGAPLRTQARLRVR